MFKSVILNVLRFSITLHFSIELVSIKLKFKIRFKVKNILFSHLSIELIYMPATLVFKKQMIPSGTNAGVTRCAVSLGLWGFTPLPLLWGAVGQRVARPAAGACTWGPHECTCLLPCGFSKSRFCTGEAVL